MINKRAAGKINVLNILNIQMRQVCTKDRKNQMLEVSLYIPDKCKTLYYGKHCFHAHNR